MSLLKRHLRQNASLWLPVTCSKVYLHFLTQASIVWVVAVHPFIVLSCGEDCYFHSSWNGGVRSVKLHLLLASAQTDLSIIPSNPILRL